MIPAKNKIWRKRIFLVIYIIFLLFLLAAGLLTSPLFKIKTVEIYGTKELVPEEIKANIEYKNILFITTDGLRQELAKKFPQISHMDIEKNLFKKTIKINLTEREKLGIVCKAEETDNNETVKSCFYIDKEGVMFKNAPQTSGSLVLLIKDFSLEDFFLGKNLFSAKVINSIIDLKENLFSQIKAKSLWFASFTYPPKEIKVMTTENWYVLFDLDRDIKSQLLLLKTALAEKIQNRSTLQYVDLRIENRIYYK
jgi:hypothetical protein